MTAPTSGPRNSLAIGVLAVLFGLGLIVFGWVMPARFKSVPMEVVREAGQGGESVGDRARFFLLDGNIGAAASLSAAALELGESKASVAATGAAREAEADEKLARWGAWDPFLDAALGDIPLASYSKEPGFLGVLLSKPNRSAVSALLENSRNPLLRDLMDTGDYTTYRRLFPVSSTSGRPLQMVLLTLGLLAQGDHMNAALRSELRERLLEAKASGNVAPLEDFYLDTLSLARLFDWGQLKELFAQLSSTEAVSQARFLLHRRPEDRDLIYAMLLAADPASSLFQHLETYGDTGFDQLKLSLAAGVEGYRLTLREQLPLEEDAVSGVGSLLATLQNKLAPFSLKNRVLSLVFKYGAFLLGSFVLLYGLSRFGGFYRERVSPLLEFTQRLFGAIASVIVLAVLSEPYLSGASAFEGYSFSFVLPVLTEVDGVLEIVETQPTTSMETATLLSIAFFFLLQALVFLICMLKVREIEKRDVDPLVKLKLMENEDNLFDSGLYVGIAGTCISLVMQVMGLVEANLIAAYSSNLFGILCVAIVKIRLVRPYKTKLIMAGQEQIAAAEVVPVAR